MKIIKTRDESVTFLNEEYNEAYHSITIGAIEEALGKYVNPSNLEEGATVLDFCFGLGYNSLAALTVVDKIKIIAIEKDEQIINEIPKIDVPDKYATKFEIIKKLAIDKKFENDTIYIELLMGDAKKEIKKITEKFDAVLFDPFSPKVCPELWTKEIFLGIAKLMKPNGTLTTYSCARIVRDNLKSAGFEVKDGPCLGRRAPSTIAIYKKVD